MRETSHLRLLTGSEEEELVEAFLPASVCGLSDPLSDFCPGTKVLVDNGLLASVVALAVEPSGLRLLCHSV